MSALLDQFQERMEDRFRSLNAARAGSGFPIFVLEHGLDEQERSQLAALLLDRIRTETNLSKHWLLWAIYATEQGYHYAGHEYWQSFEEHTPYWTYADRWRLRSWFRRFSKDFRAVVPTGPWADHFNRIAWPITHAILPKYLQNQFARALWELSYKISSLSTFDASSIGRVFSLHAHGSNRFHEFLEQEELTGRIVLALLGLQAQGGMDPIDRVTLKRLVSDLEQVRHGKEWLREARRIVQDRFIGIGRGGTGPPTQPDGKSASPHRDADPSISPSILLRAKGAGAWTALIDVPDFRPIASNPSIRVFIQSNRVRLTGVDGMRPTGWVLGARRQAVLETWPTAGAPLISFEHAHGVVDTIITGRCTMSKGPTWLFRIGADGIAREIVGRIVRPGADYLLLGHGELPNPGGWVAEAHIDCAGVSARRLSIPTAVAQEDIAAIAAMNLQVARTIRVWPAGLPGRAWNGEGSSEWLTTESPCLALVHDHPIEGFSIRLNGGSQTVIEAGRVGFPTFVRLPRLPSGVHHLSARAHRGPYASAAHPVPEAEGYLMLHVRDPQPWRPGRSFHSGLVVTSDPIEPDLDAFLENRVDLSVLGPEEHQIRCSLTLRRGDGEEFFAEPVGEPLKLPVTPATWSRHFGRFLQRHGERFLEAASGRLTIAADELGDFQIPFERNILPIRWLLRHRGDRVSAKLVDDTGHEDREPQVAYRTFSRPLASVTLSVDTLRAGMDIPAPGGLLSASVGTLSDTVVVSAAIAGGGFEGLGAQATFPELNGRAIDWRQAFQIISTWQEARFAGVLLPLRRDDVVDAFKSAVFRQICGQHWSRAEQQFLSRLNEEQSIEALRRNVDRSPGFAALLVRERSRMDGDFGEAAVWFGGRGSHYLSVTPALCQDALRVAADPCRVAEQKADAFNPLISELLAHPAVLRAARFSALLSANPLGSTVAHAYPRWSW